jgi:hypothetical protein
MAPIQVVLISVVQTMRSFSRKEISMRILQLLGNFLPVTNLEASIVMGDENEALLTVIIIATVNMIVVSAIITVNIGATDQGLDQGPHVVTEI